MRPMYCHILHSTCHGSVGGWSFQNMHNLSKSRKASGAEADCVNYNLIATSIAKLSEAQRNICYDMQCIQKWNANAP